MSITASEHTSDNEDNFDNCILERMVRKVSLMTVLAKTALLAWFIVMARKVTGQNRPMEMDWLGVKQYLAKIAIIAMAIVKDGREKNSLMIRMVKEITGYIFRGEAIFQGEDIFWEEAIFRGQVKLP